MNRLPPFQGPAKKWRWSVKDKFIARVRKTDEKRAAIKEQEQEKKQNKKK